MSERWKALRVGDRIRILAVPGQDTPGYYLHDDAKALFVRLVAERTVLQIHRIDEWGLPWVRRRFEGGTGECDHEYLAIDESDHWEYVLDDA